MYRTVGVIVKAICFPQMVMGIGLVILMASTVSILVSNVDNNTTKPKSSIDYMWPQPKLPDDFLLVKDHEGVETKDADKKVVGGAESKRGGAGNIRVEQYPDKDVKTDISKVSKSGMHED